jgi:hypothetical protein
MQEIKLNGWVAEDENRKQYFYSEKPKEIDCSFMNMGPVMELQSRLDLGSDWRKSLRRVINNKVQEPRPELKIDDPVLVKDSEGEPWRKRHFAGWDKSGKVKVFLHGKTSFSIENSCGVAVCSFYKLTFKYRANKQEQEIASNDL